MQINSVKINNFRIYSGLNEVIFKKSASSRNISIIAGHNGFGKTTFLHALVWCFYGRFIGEVDEKYKKEIYESGGYKKYAILNLNREIRNRPEDDQTYFVEVELTDVQIPTVPCNKLLIKRAYNIIAENESVSILIDGFENELTKEVGPEIFINDFILPREIAKFFFFDAERIVSLSEIKTLTEKRGLSKAYSEVLGINKYENLKKNLEVLRIKLRKKSASIEEREKLETIQNELIEIEKLVNYNNDKIGELKAEIEMNQLLSEQYQEKLIREGNSISVEELISLKKLRDKLKENNIEIKSRLKDLLELAPFAIAGKKLEETSQQITKEFKNNQKKVDNDYIGDKLKTIRNQIINSLEQRDFPIGIKNDFNTIINDIFNNNYEYEITQTLDKVLLDLTDKEYNEFKALYDNIKHSFNLTFRQIVKEEKNNKIFLAKTLRTISAAESKDSDIISKKFKLEKSKIDKKLTALNFAVNKTYEELGRLQQIYATKSKLVAELSKTVSLDEIDNKKDEVVARLISELIEFIYKYKLNKKISLKQRILNGLKNLMHKKDFIADVDIYIGEDIFEINLIDRNGNLIEKETLSKGEQQLYATALLKSLVDESEIKFPIFIDSPLQKFDKKHSKNIMQEFYPSISKQVILLPLLEKELTEKEYNILFPNINQTFILKNIGEKSSINECNPRELFNEIEISQNVHTYKNSKD